MQIIKTGDVKSIDEVLERCKFEIENDMMTMLIVTGEPGGGKSDFVMDIGERWSKLTGTSFSPKKNLCYGSKGLERLSYDLDPLSLVWLDEGGEAGYNRRGMDEDQVNTIQFFMTNRILNKLYVWCIPKAKRLDLVFMEDNCQWWFDVRFIDRDTMKRGKVYISYRGDYDQFVSDPWNIKNKWLHEKYNLRGHDTFAKVDDKRWSEYLKCKDKFMKDRRKRGRDKYKLMFLKLLDYCNFAKGMSLRDLQKIVGRSPAMLSRDLSKYRERLKMQQKDV